MGLRFFLLVNKQGQTRVAQYYQYKDVETRMTLEAEIIRKCLARTERQIIFRRYASLYFIVGADNDENELAILEFIHMVVETMDQYFEGVIMFNIDKAHFILDEMIANGEIVETNKTRIIAPIRVIDKMDKLTSN
eukprot:gene1242-4451_t